MGFTSRQHSFIKTRQKQLAVKLYFKYAEIKKLVKARMDRYLATEIRAGKLKTLLYKRDRYKRCAEIIAEKRARKIVFESMRSEVEKYLDNQ